MIVCVCHRVSDRDIARSAHEGCASFDELQLELSVATSCGRCHDCARETFQRHASQVKQALAHGPGGTGSTHLPAVRIAVIPHHDAAQATA